MVLEEELMMLMVCLSFFLWQTSRARLFKEFKEVQRDKGSDPDIQLICDDTNIFRWTAQIKVGCILILQLLLLPSGVYTILFIFGKPIISSISVYNLLL